MIFIDMDGTLAQIYQKQNYLEAMYEKGFFAGLKPYAWVSALNAYAKTRDDIYILSACVDTPYCEIEKRYWLRTYLPNIPEANYLFCKVGENKAQVVLERLGDKAGYNILVDDYSVNLYEWQMTERNFVAIKFINEVNNKCGNTYRYKIKSLGEFARVLDLIEGQ